MQRGHVLDRDRVVARVTQVGLDQLDQPQVLRAVDAGVGEVGCVDIEDQVACHAGIMHEGCDAVVLDPVSVPAPG